MQYLSLFWLQEALRFYAVRWLSSVESIAHQVKSIRNSWVPEVCGYDCHHNGSICRRQMLLKERRQQVSTHALSQRLFDHHLLLLIQLVSLLWQKTTYGGVEDKGVGRFVYVGGYPWRPHWPQRWAPDLRNMCCLCCKEGERRTPGRSSNMRFRGIITILSRNAVCLKGGNWCFQLYSTSTLPHPGTVGT